ncbi:hypothetical protein GC173_07605 [bacterium]|nr:hypothetical protein [bacterium]
MRATLMLATSLLVMSAPPGAAFTAGSTGADGALVFPSGDGSPQVIDFDPAGFPTPLDQDGDGVYHFTSVTIPANVTVKLRADRCGYHPVYWLSSGPVLIAGTLDLNGEIPVEVPYGMITRPTIPGPGGFPGGVGEASELALAQPGLGPGGGQFPSASGSHATAGYLAFGFPPYGNPFLVPLIGGSGGAGSPRDNGLNPIRTVLSGGAGGGAILIASDASIVVAGQILALGGDKLDGREGGVFPQVYLSGAGSGGAIRLVAPSISGSGKIATRRGEFDFSPAPGGDGRVRMEALEDTFSGPVLGSSRRVTLLDSTPLGLPSDSPTGTVTVTRIAGVAVPVRPGGGFAAPDLEMDDAAPVQIEIEARHVPIGTTVTVYLFNETSFLESIVSEPLTGNIASSSTTASAALKHGFTRGYAVATWSNP